MASVKEGLQHDRCAHFFIFSFSATVSAVCVRAALPHVRTKNLGNVSIIAYTLQKTFFLGIVLFSSTNANLFPVKILNEDAFF